MLSIICDYGISKSVQQTLKGQNAAHKKALYFNDSVLFGSEWQLCRTSLLAASEQSRANLQTAACLCKI